MAAVPFCFVVDVCNFVTCAAAATYYESARSKTCVALKKVLYVI
jgi:hypothetical protein